MRPSVRAYMLADAIGRFYASETFHQTTMAMEPSEFRDFLAEAMDAVLQGPLLASTPPPPDFQPEESASLPSAITHSAAKQLLENAPSKVKQVYAEMRRSGETAADALAGAMAELQRMQEAAYESQISN